MTLGTGVLVFAGSGAVTIGPSTPTSFTAGSIIFSNGTTLAEDNAILFFDDANNRIGVGTNVCGARISLPVTTGTTGGILFGDYFLYRQTANRLVFRSGTTTTFRIESTSGNAAEFSFDNTTLIIGNTTAISMTSPTTFTSGQTVFRRSGASQVRLTETSSGNSFDFYCNTSGQLEPSGSVQFAGRQYFNATSEVFALNLKYNSSAAAHVWIGSDNSGTFTMSRETGAVMMSVNASGLITTASATMIASSVAFTNGAGASAGTLTNAPAAGNPTKWIPINDNGTTRYIPAW